MSCSFLRRSSSEICDETFVDVDEEADEDVDDAEVDETEDEDETAEADAEDDEQEDPHDEEAEDGAGEDVDDTEEEDEDCETVPTADSFDCGAEACSVVCSFLLFPPFFTFAFSSLFAFDFALGSFGLAVCFVFGGFALTGFFFFPPDPELASPFSSSSSSAKRSCSLTHATRVPVGSARVGVRARACRKSGRNSARRHTVATSYLYAI